MIGKFVKAVFFGLALYSSASTADTGQIREEQCIGNWCSAIFHINNTDRIRMSSRSILNNQNSLVIDFIGNDAAGFVVFIPKGNSDIGNVYAPKQGLQIPCSLTFDPGSSAGYSSDYCSVGDDNSMFYVEIPIGLNDYLEGCFEYFNIVELQIGSGRNSFHDTYSLKGFTSSLKRVHTLMK